MGHPLYPTYEDRRATARNASVIKKRERTRIGRGASSSTPRILWNVFIYCIYSKCKCTHTHTDNHSQSAENKFTPRFSHGLSPSTDCFSLGRPSCHQLRLATASRRYTLREEEREASTNIRRCRRRIFIFLHTMCKVFGGPRLQYSPKMRGHGYASKRQV